MIGTYATTVVNNFGQNGQIYAFHGYACLDPWSSDGLNCVSGWAGTSCGNSYDYLCEIPQRAFTCFPPPTPPPPPPNPPSPPRPPQPPICELQLQAVTIVCHSPAPVQPIKEGKRVHLGLSWCAECFSQWPARPVVAGCIKGHNSRLENAFSSCLLACNEHEVW